MEIYVNKIKNKIVFKIKTGCKLEFLSPETMKLLGSTKNMLIKIKMENCFVNCNLVNNYYQQASSII